MGNKLLIIIVVADALVHTHNTMMKSSNGNIFCITGPLCGEFTDHRWIPLTKASDAELWRSDVFLDLRLTKNTWINNGEAGDLKCPHAHYDIIVMLNQYLLFQSSFIKNNNAHFKIHFQSMNYTAHMKKIKVDQRITHFGSKNYLSFEVKEQ